MSAFLLYGYSVPNRELEGEKRLGGTNDEFFGCFSFSSLFWVGVHQDILGIPRSLEVAANHAIVTAMAIQAVVTPWLEVRWTHTFVNLHLSIWYKIVVGKEPWQIFSGTIIHKSSEQMISFFWQPWEWMLRQYLQFGK